MEPTQNAKTKPAHFYKYREVNENTGKIITRNEIWFAKRSTLNDPFDSSVAYVSDMTADQLAQTAIRIANEECGPDNLAQNRRIRDVVKREYKERNRTERENDAQARLDHLLDRELFVFCVSAVSDDILMWSHYTNGHKGICLEFDANIEPFHSFARPIDYSECYPEYREGSYERALEAVHTKSVHWAYEQEWRIRSETHGPRMVEDRALTGVILGCAIESEHEQQVKKWIADRHRSPRLYRAVKKPRQYGLDIVEL